MRHPRARRTHATPSFDWSFVFKIVLVLLILGWGFGLYYFLRAPTPEIYRSEPPKKDEITAASPGAVDDKATQQRIDEAKKLLEDLQDQLKALQHLEEIDLRHQAEEAAPPPVPAEPAPTAQPQPLVRLVNDVNNLVNFVKAFTKEPAKPDQPPAVLPAPAENPAPPAPVAAPQVAPDPAIVILTHNRPAELERTLDSVLRQPAYYLDQFKVYVSCDDPDSYGAVQSTINRVVAATGSKTRVELWRQTQFLPTHSFEKGNFFKIAWHYKLSMDGAFLTQKHSHALLVEDDLLLAPDSLEYFLAALPLLAQDPTLWCISAWHDNGLTEQLDLVHDQTKLFRTDFFPGLGWLLSRELWVSELRARWPMRATTGWDHWMRLSTTAHGRECVAPVVSRTKHISTQGVNVKPEHAAQYERYALATRTSSEPGQPSGFGDLSYLLAAKYETLVKASIAEAKVIYNINDAVGAGEFVLPYFLEDYQTIALQLQLWSDRGPRATHKGLLRAHSPHHPSITIFLADRRACPYLPDHERRHLHPQAVFVGAHSAEPCATACRRYEPDNAGGFLGGQLLRGSKSYRCDGLQLPFANDCAQLAKAFKCESGCGHQTGEEIPAYVTEPTEDSVGQCLITDAAKTNCEAAHASTRRLCVCVPS